jgi:hypothetical protein
MDDCPYCGEEVSADTVQCPKCAAILKEVDDTEMAEFEKEAEKKTEKRHEPCPHCGAPAPKGCHRCNECGRVVNALPDAATHDSFKYGTWLVFGGVGFLVLLILAIAIMLAGSGEEKRQYVVINGPALSARYSAARLKSAGAKAESEWEKKYGNKYVRWSGKVVSIDGSMVEFAVTGGGMKANKAEVRVEFLGSADEFVETLAKGKTVSYDAKLIAYNEEGYRFIMENGKAIESD